MPLIQQTTAQRIAAKIDSINSESISFLRAQMQRAYDLANTQGEQQAIMDAFGVNAVQAIGVYSVMRGALDAIGAASGLPIADIEVFQPQIDGSVVYVAPPEPVIEKPPIIEP